MKRLICLMSCGVLAGFAAPAPAQDRTGSVYVNAGVSVPHQAPPGDGTKPPFAAPGGTTVGWFAGAGVFISPQVSVEAEVSSTGMMRSTQRGRGFVEVSERRDRFVSLGIKGHLEIHRLVFGEPVGGIVLILPGDTAMQTSRSTFSGALTPPDLSWADLEPDIGFMFGTDLRIGGRRVAVVPGFRIAYSHVSEGARYSTGFRGDEQPVSQIFQGGYPKWTYRPSVSMRVDF